MLKIEQLLHVSRRLLFYRLVDFFLLRVNEKQRKASFPESEVRTCAKSTYTHTHTHTHMLVSSVLFYSLTSGVGEHQELRMVSP